MNEGKRGGGLRILLVSVMILSAARSVSVGDEVRRIVSLAPSVTETVAALGAADWLVGVSVHCDYPPKVRKIERVGTFLSPKVESIVAKKPDVVLAVPSPSNRNPVESLRELGLRVVVVEAETLADIKQSILTIGREIGRDAAAKALVLQIEGRMAEVRARVAGAPRRKVLMVIGHTPLHAVGAGTFLHELIEMAGGINLGAQAAGSWPQLGLELALGAEPEVIIDASMGSEEHVGTAGVTDFWKTFPSIPAVRDGRIYAHEEYHLLRPGPRMAEALETLARFIHPERFSQDSVAGTSGAAQVEAARSKSGRGGPDGMSRRAEGAQR